MILTVDIGNTNIKIGAWDNNRLTFISRLETNTRCTGDEYAIKLLEIFRLNNCNNSQFDGAMISSVVPPLSVTMVNVVRQVIQSQRVYLISPGVKTGLNIRTDNPATLGSDLVCAAVAASNKYPLPCIVIGLGTATTICAINENAEFVGTAISPGIGISLEALTSQAAQLANISLENPSKVIGTNTTDSMKSGVIFGTASMLDGMIQRMREQLGQISTVVAMGGFMDRIIPHCREHILEDDNMVLEGLHIIFYKNVK